MQITALRLSDSSRQTFHTCARLLEFKKFYNINLRQNSLPGDVGSAYHAGYQEFFRTGDVFAAWKTLLFNLPDGVTDMPPSSPYSLETTYAVFTAMLKHKFNSQYEITQIQTPAGLQPAIEVPIRININGFNLSSDPAVNIPVYYVGFIDLILYDILNNCYIICDIKTHTNNMNDLTAKYAFADQLLPYAMVLESVLGHTLENFKVLYFSVLRSLDNPQPVVYEFQKTHEDVQDWIKGFILDLKTIKQYYHMQWFPRRSAACIAYNRVCPFLNFCSSRNTKTIHDMLLLLEDSHQEKEVNPLLTLDLDIAGIQTL